MKEFTFISSLFGVMFLMVGGVLAFTPAHGTPCQTIPCSGRIVYQESPQSIQLGTSSTTKSGPNHVGLTTISTGIGFFIVGSLHTRKPS